MERVQRGYLCLQNDYVAAAAYQLASVHMRHSLARCGGHSGQSRLRLRCAVTETVSRHREPPSIPNQHLCSTN
jgi:hypothetical protein